MNDQIQLLVEAWGKLKVYIPAKDRSDAAIAYVKLIDDFGANDQDWQEVFSHSTRLHEAYKEIFGEEEEEEYEDDYNNQEENY